MIEVVIHVNRVDDDLFHLSITHIPSIIEVYSSTLEIWVMITTEAVVLH